MTACVREDGASCGAASLGAGARDSTLAIDGEGRAAVDGEGVEVDAHADARMREAPARAAQRGMAWRRVLSSMPCIRGPRPRGWVD